MYYTIRPAHPQHAHENSNHNNYYASVGGVFACKASSAGEGSAGVLLGVRKFLLAIFSTLKVS